MSVAPTIRRLRSVEPLEKIEPLPLLSTRWTIELSTTIDHKRIPTRKKNLTHRQASVRTLAR